MKRISLGKLRLENFSCSSYNLFVILHKKVSLPLQIIDEERGSSIGLDERLEIIFRSIDTPFRNG